MSQDTQALYNSPECVIFPTVDIMLDLENSLSNAVISADQRQVQAGCCSMLKNAYPCNFSNLDVFGCQNFSSGKYYWEVDVSGKIAWILERSWGKDFYGEKGEGSEARRSFDWL